MRILVAGGVFRLSPEERARRQPAPEVNLVNGLRDCGVDAVESPLEDLSRVSLDRTFDLVHVHHLSKAAVAASISPLPRPMVFTEHGMPNGYSRNIALARRYIYRRASGVVCLSHLEREIKMAEFSLTNDRTWVIPNPATLSGATANFRSANGLRMLYVGQLIPLKQVDRLIGALPGLPSDVTLRLVFHNDELQPYLENLAAELNVRDRVEFTGQLSGASLSAAYLEAHVLMLPSAHEALPSVVTEALLTGLPVIASAVGGVPEQVGAAGILVSPGTTESLVGAINALRDDYASFARAALARAAGVRVEFGMEQSIRKHLAMYRQLLETPST